MNFLNRVLSPSTMQQIQGIQDFVVAGWNQCEEKYCEFEEQFLAETKKLLPDQMQALVKKVMRSIPDILFSACVLTGYLNMVTTLYWTAHVVWVLQPMFTALARGQQPEDSELWITEESRQRVQELYERFKPAILVSSAIAAVAYATVGLFTLRVEPFVYATGALACAALAYDSIDFKKLQKEVHPEGEVHPPGNGSLT
jgi:hypothetical protein